MEEIDSKNLELTKDEKDFCELLVYGVEPYVGNPRKCYEGVFKEKKSTSLLLANKLMARPEIKRYIGELRLVNSYNSENLRPRLTEKLLNIIDETSSASFMDKFQNPISPAAMRSVSVSAIKTLMDLQGLKQTEKNDEDGGNGKGSRNGVTINVITPNAGEKPIIESKE